MVDPATNKVYLLISREQYDKLKPLFENEPLSNLEQRELLRQAGRRAGWDEPAMDAYDHYDEHRAAAMKVRRGDVVLVDYPYSDRTGSKYSSVPHRAGRSQ